MFICTEQPVELEQKMSMGLERARCSQATLSWLCHTNWPCHGMVIMKQDMDGPTVEYGSPHGKNDKDNTPRWE